jgi:fibronectin-binding autotransporter adhesin
MFRCNTCLFGDLRDRSASRFCQAILVLLLAAVLGPRAQAANINLKGNDGGSTSSFTSPLTGAAAGWGSSGTAASAGNNYEVPGTSGAYLLRSPATNGTYNFAGNSLQLDSGTRFLIKGAGQIGTSNLILNGGLVDLSTVGGLLTLTGSAGAVGTITLNPSSTSYIGAENGGGAGVLTVSSSITGSGNLVFNPTTANPNPPFQNFTAANPFTQLITLTAANNYTGTTTLGTGTLQLGNANALQSTTVTDNGTLGFSPTIGTFNLGGLSGSNSLTLSDTANGAIALQVGGDGASTTFSGALGGNGSLTKAGNGVLTLSGSSGYTGGTTINSGGILATNTAGSALGSGTVAVNSAGFLGGSGTIGGAVTVSAGTLAPATSPIGFSHLTIAGSLTVAGGANFNYHLTGGGSDQVIVSGNGHAMTLNGVTDTLNLSTFGGYSPTLPSSIPILVAANGATLTDNVPDSGWTITGPAIYSFQIISPTDTMAGGSPINGVPGEVILYSTTGNPSLTWTGSNGAAWDYATANWSPATNNGVYQDGFNVTFDDTNTSGNTTITVTASGVAPKSVTFNNSLLSYTLSGGSIAATGGLTMTGSGGVTLNNVNIYGGAATISGGTLTIGSGGSLTAAVIVVAAAGNLNVGNGGALGSSTVLADNGSVGFNSVSQTLASLSGAGLLTLNGTTLTLGAMSFTGSINGTGGVVYNLGSGTATLSGGNNTYSGDTVVNSGQLTLASSAALLNSTLNSGGGTIGFSSSVASHAFTLGGLGGGSGITLADNAANPVALTVGNNNHSTTYSGSLNGTGGSLIKIGNGSLTLAGANTYNGGTLVLGGTLALANGNALQNSTVTPGNGIAFSSAVSSAAFTFGGLSGGGNLNLANDAGSPVSLSVGNNNGSTVYSGALTGTGGSLTLLGSGGLTLTGVSNYGGGTTVSSGTLLLGGGALSAAGPVSVASAAVFGGSGSAGTVTVNTGGALQGGYGGAGTLTLGGLNFGSGSTLNVLNYANYLSSGSSAAVNVTTGGGLSAVGGTGSVAINLGGAVPTIGNFTYHLIQYSGSFGTGGISAFTLGTTPGGARASYALANDAGYVDLVTTNDFPYWTGTNPSNWLGGNNWMLNFAGTATDFLAGDQVVFDNRAVNTAVNVNATVSPTSATFSGTNNFTLSGTGSIAGSASLAVQGPGSVTIDNSNSYTGGTTLSGGVLNVNNPAALGSGTLSISGGTLDNTSAAAIAVNPAITQQWNGGFTFLGTQNLDLGNGAITLSSSPTVNVAGGTLSVEGSISGSNQTLTKSGAGTLVLAGANTFSGGTTLSGGVLDVNNPAALGSGTLTITGGTLDNTSAAAIAVNPAITQQWNGGFTFLGTRNLDLGNGAVTLSGSPTVNVAGGTLSVEGSISGSNQLLSKSGAGTLVLVGANTYSGGTTISGGVLYGGYGGNTVLPANETITVNAGATLAFSMSNETNRGMGTSRIFSIAGSGSTGQGALKITTLTAAQGATTANEDLQINNVTLTGNAMVAAYGGDGYNGGFHWGEQGGNLNLSGYTLTIYSDPNTENQILGTNWITGPGAVVISGGNIHLQNNQNFTGSITVNSGANFGAYHDVTVAANMVMNGGTLSALYTGTNAPMYTGNVSLPGNGTLCNVYMGGSIGMGITLQGVVSGPGNLTMASGTNTLAGANTFTGATIANGGTIILANSAALQNSTLQANGASVVFSTSAASQAFTFGGISGGGSLSLADNGGNPLALSVGNNNASTTYSGVLSGGGSLVKAGTGTLTLAGINTYAGPTTISGGTIKLQPVAGYRYYEFQATSANSGTTVQLSELAFYSAGSNNSNGTRVIPIGVSGGGTWNTGEGPTNLYDNNLNTKWCDIQGTFPQSVTFDFGQPAMFTGYDWATANDNTPNRNPQNWQVLASNNGSTWITIDTRSNAGNTPTNTFTWANGWSITPPQLGLPATTALVISASGVFDLNGGSQQVASLGDYAPGLGGTVINSATGTTSVLTVSPTGGSTTTFSGIIAGGGTLGTIGLTMSGNGTLVLAGTNSYSGGTTINSGALVAGAANALSPNSSYSVSGGTLDASLYAQTIQSLSIGAGGTLNLGIGNFLTSTGTASFAPGSTLNIFGSIGTLPETLMTYNTSTGTLSNVFGLPGTDQLSYSGGSLEIVNATISAMWTQPAGGSWTMGSNWSSNPTPPTSGTVTFSELGAPSAITVTLDGPQSAGALVFSASEGYLLAAGNNGTLTLSNSASITVLSGTHTISAPVEIALGSLVISASNASSVNISGNISDDNGHESLTLMGDGSGTLVLSGTNSYGGGTYVDAGTLIVTSPEALADGSSLIVGQGASALFAPASAGPAGHEYMVPAAVPGVTAVPEPGTWALLLVGLGGAAIYGRLRRRTNSSRWGVM